MDVFPPTEAGAWAETCAARLRAGDTRGLGALLAAAPQETPPALVAFYAGQQALARVDYPLALRAFQHAAQAAVYPALAHTSACWLAFVHTALGQYDLAAALLASPPPDQTDPAALGTYRLAQGLLESYRGTLVDGQAALEQALTLARQAGDRWLATLTQIILVSVYQHQGHLNRAMRLLRQLGYPDGLAALEPVRQVQVRNMAVNCLRLMGQLEAACACGWPLPSGTPFDNHRFAVWLALSVAVAAADADGFAAAERAWASARARVASETDELGQAEIHWVRAWLSLRQGRLAEADAHIQTALAWIDDLMDTDYLHARAIAGVIALEQGDLGMAACHLHAACVGFEATGHRMGALGARIHLACYYWQSQQHTAARAALAEIWSALHASGLMGAYYWLPSTMITVCTLAITGDLWAAGAQEPAAVIWGDMAATVAAQRLARSHWRAFVPLLDDPRPNVRRRVLQVLRAAKDPAAERLAGAPPALPAPPAPPARSGLTIHTFGTFRVLRDGEPVQVRRAGTRKVLAVLGILLLVGERGVESRDLALLLWPGRNDAHQRGSLHSAISAARAVLEDPDGTLLEAAAGRYYLHLPQEGLWWDWAERRRQIQRAVALQEDEPAEIAGFLEGFFDLIPEPPPLPEPLQRQWESLYEWLHELVEARAAEVSDWAAVG